MKIKLTRQQLIDKGKIWQVYPDSNTEEILHEGTRSACIKFMRNKKLTREYYKGKIRLAKVIWEKDNLTPNTI